MHLKNNVALFKEGSYASVMSLQKMDLKKKAFIHTVQKNLQTNILCHQQTTDSKFGLSYILFSFINLALFAFIIFTITLSTSPLAESLLSFSNNKSPKDLIIEPARFSYSDLTPKICRTSVTYQYCTCAKKKQLKAGKKARRKSEIW